MGPNGLPAWMRRLQRRTKLCEVAASWELRRPDVRPRRRWAAGFLLHTLYNGLCGALWTPIITAHCFFSIHRSIPSIQSFVFAFKGRRGTLTHQSSSHHALFRPRPRPKLRRTIASKRSISSHLHIFSSIDIDGFIEYTQFMLEMSAWVWGDNEHTAHPSSRVNKINRRESEVVYTFRAVTYAQQNVSHTTTILVQINLQKLVALKLQWRF